MFEPWAYYLESQADIFLILTKHSTYGWSVHHANCGTCLYTCVRKRKSGMFRAMSANGPTAGTLPSGKQSARLRLIALVVLLLGLAAAGSLYWMRTHSGEPMEDELLAGSAKAESRQMEILYGKMGVLTHELSDDLKQPGTQACLIAAFSIVLAAGIFYIARLSENDEHVD
jgi:hypothetical protein